MKRKIFRSMLLLSLITVLFSVSLLSFMTYRQLSENMERELNNQIAYVSAGYYTGDIEYLASIRGENENSRVTLIDREGTVLFDTRADAAMMENHGDRPEVQGALEHGRSVAVRLSSTLESQYYYVAVRLIDGRVLRVSSATDSIWAVLANSGPVLIVITLLIFLMATIIAGFQTRRIVKPINEIDLEHPIDNEIYEEFSPLLIRIHHLHDSMEKQMQELAEQAQKFNEITENMEEGLIVLDADGSIVSANQSALVFLNAKDSDHIGKHYTNINRNLAFLETVESTLGGGHLEETIQTDNHIFQLRGTPVLWESKIKGAILLLLDLTDKQKSETLRREFTANVSHELKTPLTAILGYAEMIKNGMADTKDVPGFGQRIYDQTNSLIALVDDIIRLSQLDERSIPEPMEEMDLLKAVNAVVERLEPYAKKYGVRLTVFGESETVKGVPTLIDDLIVNLCDNSIKYNNPGGTVRLSVKKTGDGIELEVEDNGIGISSEHQERIFERFYRVDKSHSKETGGTGLGLSIVKHIATYHRASVRLKSEEGKGTQITVTFPS